VPNAGAVEIIATKKPINTNWDSLRDSWLMDVSIQIDLLQLREKSLKKEKFRKQKLRGYGQITL
jgi:hypothetical protein